MTLWHCRSIFSWWFVCLENTTAERSSPARLRPQSHGSGPPPGAVEGDRLGGEGEGCRPTGGPASSPRQWVTLSPREVSATYSRPGKHSAFAWVAVLW